MLSTCVDDGKMGHVVRRDCAAEGLVCRGTFAGTPRDGCVPAACSNPCFQRGLSACSPLLAIDTCTAGAAGCDSWTVADDCLARGQKCDPGGTTCHP